MKNTEWVATKFVRKCDLDSSSLNLNPVTIDMCVSPFYEGTRWAVRRGSQCLNVKGEWVYEPMPSSRTDLFYKQCRFPSREAAEAMAEMELARRIA